MKKILSLFTAIIALNTFAFAQTTELEYIKTQYNSDKKTLLMNYMKLSEADAALFWPIYNEYEQERTALSDKRMTNLKAYADQYKTMTNEQADAIVQQFFANEAKKSALEKKYYGQMKKKLSAKTATSWLQFEEYLNSAIRFALFDSIPFVEGE